MDWLFLQWISIQAIHISLILQWIASVLRWISIQALHNVSLISQWIALSSQRSSIHAIHVSLILQGVVVFLRWISILAMHISFILEWIVFFCLGWLGDVVGVFVVSCFPKTEFFVFCSLECSGGGRSAVGFHGNEKYMAVPLGAGVQGDGWHCLEFLRNWLSVLSVFWERMHAGHVRAPSLG